MSSTSPRAPTAKALTRLFAAAIASATAATAASSCLLGVVVPCSHVRSYAPDAISDTAKAAWPDDCAELCTEAALGPTRDCAVEVFFTQSPSQRDHVTCRYPGGRTQALYSPEKLPLGAPTPQVFCGSCASDPKSVGCLRDGNFLECQGEEFTCEGAGRRLRGARCARTRSSGSVAARWFSRAAVLEARSATAFEELATDLEALGAPRALSVRAGRAAVDELRHAAAMASLAARAGASSRTPRAPASRVRPAPELEALARENAVEGCVRETFGALLLTWQADATSVPAVSRELRRIARDEARHAALSFAIHRWATARLDVDANRRVARAARGAVVALRRSLGRSRAGDLETTLGRPSPSVAAHLLDHLFDPARRPD